MEQRRKYVENRSVTPDPIAARPKRDSTLFVLGLGILAFTVAAFALVALREPVRLTRYTPLVTLHAVLMVAWYSLFVVQSRLVLDRKHRIHRRLGLFSIALAAGMVVTGLLAVANFYEELGRRLTLLVADIGIFVNFVPLYAIGVWAAMKKRFDVHKRVILVASISMTTPALARALDVVGVSRTATVLLYPLLLIALPMVYDRRTLGRVQKASLWAVAFSLVVFAGQVAAFVIIGPE